VLGQRLLKPQEETVLKIIYHTINRPGPFTKRVMVTTNISGQKDIEITLKGTVNEAPAAKIRVEPRKHRLGFIKQGAVRNLIYTIKNEGRKPLVVTRIFAKEDTAVYFDGKKEGNLVIEPKESRVFEIGFKPVGAGPFTQVIFFDSNATNARHGRYAIMLIGEIVAN
jgi:hypothetical protein